MGGAYKTTLAKIKTKQNKCVRCIFFVNTCNRETALPYYKLLEFLTLDTIYKFRISIFAYKITTQHTNISDVFVNYITEASDVHSYNTRYAKKQKNCTT